MRKLKILMATADHLMIDRRILQEAKSLVDKGHEVTLLAGFECPKRESFLVDGIRIERFVYDWGDSRLSALTARLGLVPGGRIYALAWRLFRFLTNRLASLNSFEQFVLDRLLEYQVDVLHIHDYPMLAPAVELARIRRVPLVYDAHELYYAQVQLPPHVQRRYRRREARLIRYADVVITVNPYIARLMAQRYRIPEPRVLMNAAPLRPIDTSKPLRKRFNFSDNTRIVLYQGWISDNRGIERVVEAADFFAPRVVLVIIGYGDYEEELKKLVVAKGLSERVFFYGGVPSDELHPLTCDADLGVIPYHGVDENNYFCSPNKLFEFAVAALPYVCNDLPFLRDTATRYGNGRLADLGSPAAIAKAVNSIFTNEGEFASMRAGARAAREALNWNVEERKLFEYYESLSV